MKRKTSIIILTYNHLDYTKKCIESIQKYTKKDTYEIIIVDNLSQDETRSWLQKQPFKVLLNEENAGFPKGCNQGINLADKENDILLLNNDTIVTTNWLENLKICLESSPDIGCVGAVCNQNENQQGVSFTYKDMKEMQQLAKENNVSDSTQWEEKAFLIGFCILIKNEVIQKIKQLDEEYTPGYIEDNDLSLRILNLGYRLYLCHDAFIHHYLGTSFRKDLTKFYPILFKNRAYFEKKWHFNTFEFDQIKSASFPLLSPVSNLLELNCGIGITLLRLKYQYPNMQIDGIEKDDNKRHFAQKFAKVYAKVSEIAESRYDVILIGDILEKVEDINLFLEEIKKYLKPNGSIIGEFHNAISSKKIIKLMTEECYQTFKEQKNYFSMKEIKQILNNHNYQQISTFSWYEEKNDDEIKFLKIFEKEYPDLKYTYYTFKATVHHE